ncbi:hypothetical protein ABK040_004534 [Willaertia magna]
MASELKEQFNEATNKLVQLQTEISKQLQELEAKEKKFNSMLKEMEKVANLQSNKIKLNVGGKLFTTTKDTLMKYKDSFFFSMLSSGKWLPDEDDGAYFIDRNPKLFTIIMDFLRNDGLSETELRVLTNVQKEKLLIEADYFGLDELTKILSPPPTVVPVYFVPPGNGFNSYYNTKKQK